MTRKDYIRIAEMLQDARITPIDLVARAFASVECEKNPRFDRVRFLKACGVKE